MFAIAAELEQELADVGLRSDEDEEHGVGVEDGDDGEPVSMLEDGGR